MKRFNKRFKSVICTVYWLHCGCLKWAAGFYIPAWHVMCVFIEDVSYNPSIVLTCYRPCVASLRVFQTTRREGGYILALTCNVCLAGGMRLMLTRTLRWSSHRLLRLSSSLTTSAHHFSSRLLIEATVDSSTLSSRSMSSATITRTQSSTTLQSTLSF